MRKVVLAILISSIAGCSMGHRDPVEAKQALNEAVNESNSRSLQELPASVQADLMPDLDSVDNLGQETIKRFRIKADNVNAGHSLRVW